MRSRPYGVNAGELLRSSRKDGQPGRQESDSVSVRPVRLRGQFEDVVGGRDVVVFAHHLRLDRQVSAVDGDAASGDVRRGIGTQEQCRTGAVLGCPGPAQRSVEADLDVHDLRDAIAGCVIRVSMRRGRWR